MIPVPSESAAEKSGLVLLGQALETPHIEAMRAEAELISYMGLCGGLPMEFTQSKHSPAAVESTLLCADRASKYPGMELFVDLVIGSSRACEAKIVVIHYLPEAFQKFHPDHLDDAVACAPLDPNAALDFTGKPIDWSHPEVDPRADEDPDYIPVSYETVRPQPGDVLVQTLPKLVHRGRNRGDSERYNALVFTN